MSMNFIKRLGGGEAFVASEPLEDAVPIQSQKNYQAIKMQIHQALLRRIDLLALDRLPADRVKEELRQMTERLLGEHNLVLNGQERRILVHDIQHEMLGLGPLESLLADPTVSDILVNTHRQVYVERQGRLELTAVHFVDDAHLMKIIDKIVSQVGRRIDESSPMVDARLPDGSRINAIIPPLAIDGPILSIRRFSATPLQMPNLIAHGTLTEEMGRYLAALATSRVNILISGGAGSGKTTLMNILSGYIPAHERIVTIEDAAELQLQQPHVIRLETRPPNIEGKGEVTQHALVRNALRMRPDRIILGETRGAEALDLLQAMNTGHEGSITTLHANTPRDALIRLEHLIAMSGVDIPPRASRAQVASAIGVVVQTNRLLDGSRKVTSIAEVTGMQDETVLMQEIFAFRQTGIGPGGTVQGHFSATGLRTRFLERLSAHGQKLPDNLFHAHPTHSNPGRRTA